MRASAVLASCPEVDPEDLSAFGDVYKAKYGSAGMSRGLDAILARKSREAGDGLLLTLLDHPQTPAALLAACTKACRCRNALRATVTEEEGSPVDPPAPPASDDDDDDDDAPEAVRVVSRVVGELREAALEVRQLLTVLRQYRVELTPALADMANTAKILAGVKDALGEQTEAMGEKIEQMSELTPPSELKRVANIVPDAKRGVAEPPAVPIIRRPARRI
jgi:hypothetical protein